MEGNTEYSKYRVVQLQVKKTKTYYILIKYSQEKVYRQEKVTTQLYIQLNHLQLKGNTEYRVVQLQDFLKKISTTNANLQTRIFFLSEILLEMIF